MKLNLKVWYLKGKKVGESDFLEKNSFWVKSPEIPPKIGFFEVGKKFCPLDVCAFFRVTWCTILAFMILRKPHVFGNFDSGVISETALGQSDCRISHVIRYSWKLQFDHIVFVGCGQTCPSMPKVF